MDGPADVHTEVKWHERCRIWDWIRQAEAEARPTDIPLVCCRCNATGWWGVLPWDEWVALDALRPRREFVFMRRSGRLAFWKWLVEAERAALAMNGAPRVKFARPESGWYAAVPLDELLALLRMRETA